MSTEPRYQVVSESRSSIPDQLHVQYTYNHYADIRDVTKILKSVESYRGKTGSRDKKLGDDYAMEVFGHKHFAPWLYVYSAVSGKFKEGWMPENYYGSVVVPKLSGRYGRVADLRALNAVILQSDAFPDLLAYVNGTFFDTAYRFVSPDAVKTTLFKDHERVVFKLDHSLQGRGIQFFHSRVIQYRADTTAWERSVSTRHPTPWVVCGVRKRFRGDRTNHHRIRG